MVTNSPQFLACGPSSQRACRGLEAALQYTFADKALAQQAITHCSYPEATDGCYQRLKFLGDATLDFMVTLHSYQQYR